MNESWKKSLEIMVVHIFLRLSVKNFIVPPNFYWSPLAKKVHWLKKQGDYNLEMHVQQLSTHYSHMVAITKATVMTSPWKQCHTRAQGISEAVNVPVVGSLCRERKREGGRKGGRA